MADLDRRRFLTAIGLAPAAVVMLTGCPGGGEDDGDGEDGDEGGEDDD